MTLSELLARLKKAKQEKTNFNNILVEIHKKFSIPVACLAVTLIGMPLGVFQKRGGRGISLGISLGLIIVYYFFFVAGENLGNRGKIPPWVGMWFSNFLLSTIGIYLIIRKVLGKNLWSWRKKKRGVR
jgi:lipopolysaccharide export system permease protein